MSEKFISPEHTAPVQPESIWQSVQRIGEARRVVEEFNGEALLGPYAGYFPDTSNVTNALLSIEEYFEWTPDQVMHVVVDIHNTFDAPLRVHDEFWPLKIGSNPPLQFRLDEHRIVRAGTTEKVARLELLPVPEFTVSQQYSPHDAKGKIAEDIARYLSRSVPREDRSNPEKYQQFMNVVEPFLLYGDMMHAISEHEEAYTKTQTQQKQHYKEFTDILKEPTGIGALYRDAGEIIALSGKSSTVVQDEAEPTLFDYVAEDVWLDKECQVAQQELRAQADESARVLNFQLSWVIREHDHDQRHRMYAD